MSFDYIIVGGGPCGLTCAQLLSRTNKSILFLDAANSFGGCHRVDRVEGKYFTEHSPRIYSTTYKNFDTLLHDMNTSFQDLFTRYNFSISNIGEKTVKDMKICELATLAIAFLKLIINNDYGINISMKQYMLDNNFSPDTMTYIDRVCRVVDGAASDKFSLNEFLQIVNQQFLYPLYEPKLPNDLGLIKVWTNFIAKRGVTLKLNCSLTSVDAPNNVIKTSGGDFKYGKLILALNPYNIFNISTNLFSDITVMYAARTRYMTYVSLSFYWNRKVQLPDIHGFSASEWGVVFIVMSNYFTNTPNETIISVAVSILDVPSLVTGKTANQTNTIEELKTEVFRQFCTSFKGVDIPPPDVISMYPGVKYGGPPGMGGWYSESGSFFNSFQNANTFIPFQSSVYPNVYNVGCQNGQQTYRFTSMESAVTNSIVLCKQLEPSVTSDIYLKTALQVSDFFFVIKLITMVVLIYKCRNMVLKPDVWSIIVLSIIISLCILSAKLKE